MAGTAYDDLRRHASERPGDAAIVGWRERRRAIETVSFGGLLEVVERTAGNLAALGIGRGDVVSLQLPNWWEFTALHVACVRIGAITHPISPILRRRELTLQLRLARSRVLVVPDVHAGVEHGVLARAAAKEAPTVEHVLVAGDSLERSLFDRAPGVALAAPISDTGDHCELQFTSGTTGAPKGVVHTHRGVRASAAGVGDALGLGRTDAIVMASTFGHQTGFLFGCTLPLALGTTVVLQDVWDAGRMLDLADRFGATWTSMAPPMVIDLCAAAAHRDPPATLRTVRTSGGPVPWRLVGEVRDRLAARLLPSWGMTETGVCTLRRPDDPEGDHPTDGAPLPGVELRRSADGELHARTPGMFAGYLEDGGVTPAGEWFATGDAGADDGRGGVRIVGRLKDLIIRGGENVPVAEIEEILGRLPQVRDVALVAVPDARLGERACATVVPERGSTVTLGSLVRPLDAAGVTKQFWPERLLVLEEMPRTPSGKVAKGALRALAADACRAEQGRFKPGPISA